MNCKPGDLALIVRTNKDHTDCLGTIVLVGASYVVDDIAQWFITWPGQKPKSCNATKTQYAPDSCLKPVSGLPLDEEVPVEVIISNEV